MREVLALILFCLLIAVACLGAAGWALVSGEGLTLDVLLLVFVCLTLATVFGFCALWVAWDAGLLEPLKRRLTRAADPGKADSKKPSEGAKAE